MDSMCLLPSSSAKKEPLADRKDSRFLSDSLAKLSSSQKLAWSRDLFPGKGGDLSEEKMPLLRVRFRQSPEFMSRTDDIERKMDPKSEAFARDADFQEYQELFPYALRS